MNKTLVIPGHMFKSQIGSNWQLCKETESWLCDVVAFATFSMRTDFWADMAGSCCQEAKASSKQSTPLIALAYAPKCPQLRHGWC